MAKTKQKMHKTKNPPKKKNYLQWNRWRGRRTKIHPTLKTITGIRFRHLYFTFSMEYTDSLQCSENKFLRDLKIWLRFVIQSSLLSFQNTPIRKSVLTMLNNNKIILEIKILYIPRIYLNNLNFVIFLII